MLSSLCEIPFKRGDIRDFYNKSEGRLMFRREALLVNYFLRTVMVQYV